MVAENGVEPHIESYDSEVMSLLSIPRLVSAINGGRGGESNPRRPPYEDGLNTDSPCYKMVGMVGFAPTASCLRNRPSDC